MEGNSAAASEWDRDLIWNPARETFKDGLLTDANQILWSCQRKVVLAPISGVLDYLLNTYLSTGLNYCVPLGNDVGKVLLVLAGSWGKYYTIHQGWGTPTGKPHMSVIK